jgi:hypothetical protein
MGAYEAYSFINLGIDIDDINLVIRAMPYIEASQNSNCEEYFADASETGSLECMKYFASKGARKFDKAIRRVKIHPTDYKNPEEHITFLNILKTQYPDQPIPTSEALEENSDEEQ